MRRHNRRRNTPVNLSLHTIHAHRNIQRRRRQSGRIRRRQTRTIRHNLTMRTGPRTSMSSRRRSRRTSRLTGRGDRLARYPLRLRRQARPFRFNNSLYIVRNSSALTMQIISLLNTRQVTHIAMRRVRIITIRRFMATTRRHITINFI